MFLHRLFFSLFIFLVPVQSWAAESLNVAVASNFVSSFEPIAEAFEQKYGIHINVISGSTGKLYEQIAHGSPADVFLSADKEHVDLLIADGKAIADGRITYAVGRLVLWAPDAKDITDIGQTLKDAEHISLANPELAPYGRAAKQALQKLGLLDVLLPKIVYGENITQAYQFVGSKAADAGFVALSQVFTAQETSFIEIPSGDYDPLVQDAVVLSGTKQLESSQKLLLLLSSPDIVPVIKKSGYDVPARKAP